MPRNLSAEDRISAMRADLRQAMMTAFCNVLHASQLPPMTVMEIMAEAVGSIYREVADAHLGENSCPCGWEPSPETDVELLQAALAMSALPGAVYDLRMLEVAGRA